MVLEIESLQTQIQRILQSKAFRTSEVQRNLLAYLAEKSIAGTADNLKEYSVGLDVFGKPASYDPRQESTVRMHVGRLRQKLAEYYRSEGVDDLVVVDLPKGGFKVTFEPRAKLAVPENTPVEPVVIVKTHYRVEIALGAGLLIAIVCAAYFGLRLLNVERAKAPIPGQISEWTPELKQLWEPILTPGRPLMICMSTPASGRTDLGTANGAFLLGQFLGERKKDIQLTPTEQLSMAEIAMGNVVFLGPTSGGRQIHVPEDRQLVLEANGIRNLNPRPGELPLLVDRSPVDPQDTAESYALISHFPGLYGNGELLYFSGNKIPAVMGAVQAFTDPNFARTLVAKMKTPTGVVPHFYQVVLKVRSMDDMPIDFTYILHRDLEGAKPASGQGQ